MTCDRVALPAGGIAIVCSSAKRKSCDCGRAATLLCDWKVADRRSGTCDAPVCPGCATSPAPGKDLCPEHARTFSAWRAARKPASLDRNLS